jgi:3',5'-cyclic AMP phosphodiesterase CpdA
MTDWEVTETRAITRRELLRGVAAFAATAALAKGAAARALVGGPQTKPVRFALLGDWGNGDASTGRVASLMATEHDVAPLDMVLTAGDNIYPDGSASKFGSNFERPFEPVLRRKIPVYATLGNHDVRDGADAQMRYPLFNMGGRNYYSIAAGGGTAEFFMLDSNAMDQRQVDWLDRELGRSTALWKIAVFHHPTFSSGKRHGSDDGLRRELHPLFVRHGVQAAFSGHDHIYQRVTPQDGVQYFVSGAGGKIRHGDLGRDSLVAAGYDDDSHFMVVEADAARLTFRAVGVGGATVDEGSLVAKAARVTAARG